MILRLLLKIYGPNWQTSLNSDLAAVIWVCSFISTIIVVTPTSPKWLIAIPGVAGTIAMICRQIVGRLQIDAKPTPQIQEPK